MIELSQERRLWRGLAWLLVLFFGSLVVAAAVAPWVFRAFRAWGEVSDSRLVSYLAEKDFPRYFDRIRWLVVLGALPWLCRRTGLSSRKSLGLDVAPGDGRRAGGWFVLGVGMVSVLSIGQLVSGVGDPAPLETARIVELVLLGLVSAVLIGFVEELLFRGVVFRLALRPLAPILAVPVTAGIYASMHFQRVSSKVWPEDAPVTATTGFAVGWRAVVNMVATLEPLLFLGLFLAGSVLCLVVLVHRGRLWGAMGLHTGWVWGALCHRRLVEAGGSSFWWGGRSLLDGVVPFALLVVLLAVLLVVGAGRRGARGVTGGVAEGAGEG